MGVVVLAAWPREVYGGRQRAVCPLLSSRIDDTKHRIALLETAQHGIEMRNRKVRNEKSATRRRHGRQLTPKLGLDTRRSDSRLASRGHSHSARHAHVFPDRNSLSSATSVSMVRKTHTKSRKGCVSCKRRHVKVCTSLATPTWRQCIPAGAPKSCRMLAASRTRCVRRPTPSS